MIKRFWRVPVVVALLTCLCILNSALADSYVPQSTETATVTGIRHEGEKTEVSFEIFPKEITYGDFAYVLQRRTNVSDETIKSYPIFWYPDVKVLDAPYSVVLTAEGIDGEYRWKQEYPSTFEYGCAFPSEKALAPNESVIKSRMVLDFPPVEDWNTPFWKALRDKVTPEGIKCSLTFNYSSSAQRSVCYEFLMKSRPEGEMSLLEDWVKASSDKYLPYDTVGRKIWKRLGKKSTNQISLGVNKYNVSSFVRLGNRKPSDPNSPTSLKGWRELEASLAPSSMRDEIHLTCLLLEYYGSITDKGKAESSQKIADWLESLPDPQRVVLSSYLVTDGEILCDESLKDDYYKLTRAIYNILEPSAQGAVYQREYYRGEESSLIPPTGMKVQRTLEDDIRPTDEDLALGTSDLADGFRLTTITGPLKTITAVLKFVSYDADKQMATMRTRSGYQLHFSLNEFSEQDRLYILEESKKSVKP
ncbi:MAG: hypothetical protein ACI4NV_09675 [Thermoguttaceae bacterium]